jgi:hypothetical protein
MDEGIGYPARWIAVFERREKPLQSNESFNPAESEGEAWGRKSEAIIIPASEFGFTRS